MKDKVIEEIESRIEALQKDIEELKEIESPEEKLATDLHTVMCKTNHSDGCSWFYEDSCEKYAHKRYLDMAKKILSTGISPKKSIEIAEIINNG